MNPLTSAFTDELASIKLAASLPGADLVRKALTMKDPTAKAEGLKRVGQVLTGSRQRALADKYMGMVKRHGKDMDARGGKQVIRAQKDSTKPLAWQRLGDIAKEELAERQLRKGVGRAASVGGLIGTGGAIAGASQ